MALFEPMDSFISDWELRVNRRVYQASKPVFEAALREPEEQRIAFVERECSHDPELQDFVLELLRAHHQDRDSALDFAVARTLNEDEVPGAVLDRYTLIEPIGQGGFGTVWRAEQREPVKRSIAVKILKLGMDTREIVARFEAERQTLAVLDHPHIAQVLDGGTAPSGRPYFVMELVEGQPIDEFCRDRSLSIESRLQLIVKVGSALTHAHQKSIVHRDVKPSNILVAESHQEAFPKVIDFGIAKVLATEEQTHSFSGTGDRLLGTLDYIAPERLDGSDLDTRADIYSLGVVLYELLCGARPFEFSASKSQDFGEMFRQLREDLPPRPSARASTRLQGKEGAPKDTTGLNPLRLPRALRGDLDWIVMRALEKDRDRRYQTIHEFTADIERYLKREPVAAGPPSAVYRLRKFVARNRVAVGSACFTFLALVVGFIVTAQSLIWALAEKERADEASRQAQLSKEDAEEGFDLAIDAIDDFYTGVSEDLLLRQPQFSSLRRRLIQSPLSFYERMREWLGDAKEPEQREKLASALFKLGRIMMEVGALIEARDSLATAQEILERLDQQPLDAPASVRALRMQVLLSLGEVEDDLGNLNGAEEFLELALAMGHERVEESKSSENQESLAEVLGSLGTVYEHQGRLDLAEGAFEEALVWHEKAAESRNPLDWIQLDIAQQYSVLGRLALNQGNFDSAEDLFRESLARVQTIADAYPRDMMIQSRLATLHTNLGNTYGRMGQADQALREERRSAEIEERVVAAYPGVARYRAGLGNTYNSIGASLVRQGDLEGAVEAFLRSLDLLRGMEDAEDRWVLGVACSGLADTYVSQGRKSPALRLFEEAESVFDRLLAETLDPKTLASAADTFNNYGLFLVGIGEPEKALILYQKSATTREKVIEHFEENPSHPIRLMGVDLNMGRVYLFSDQLEEAESQYQRVISMRERLQNRVPPSHPEFPSIQSAYELAIWDLANVYQGMENYEESVEYWLETARLDSGKMRAPKLAQYLLDLDLGGLLDSSDEAVERMTEEGGASREDLELIVRQFLQRSALGSEEPASEELGDTLINLAQRAADLVEEDSESWRSYELLADAHLAWGEKEDGMASLDVAIDLVPPSQKKAAARLRQRRLSQSGN